MRLLSLILASLVAKGFLGPAMIAQEVAMRCKAEPRWSKTGLLTCQDDAKMGQGSERSVMALPKPIFVCNLHCTRLNVELSLRLWAPTETIVLCSTILCAPPKS